MRPTVGRIVHYYSATDDYTEPLAAIITKTFPVDERNTDGMMVSLSLFAPPDQIDFAPMPVGTKPLVPLGVKLAVVPYSVTGMRGHWTWPPREPVKDEVSLVPEDLDDDATEIVEDALRQGGYIDSPECPEGDQGQDGPAGPAGPAETPLEAGDVIVDVPTPETTDP